MQSQSSSRGSDKTGKARGPHSSLPVKDPPALKSRCLGVGEVLLNLLAPSTARSFETKAPVHWSLKHLLRVSLRTVQASGGSETGHAWTIEGFCAEPSGCTGCLKHLKLAFRGQSARPTEAAAKGGQPLCEAARGGVGFAQTQALRQVPWSFQALPEAIVGAASRRHRRGQCNLKAQAEAQTRLAKLGGLTAPCRSKIRLL